MSNDFRLGTLNQLIDFRNGKAIKKSNGGIPIYGGNGVLGYSDKSNYENTLIVGRVGAYCGSVHIETEKCWVSDNAIAGLPKAGYNNEYNYYLLKSLRLNEQRIGSSQPLLTQGILNNIQVKIQFNSKQQDKIAAVLSALDAKIACNNRINAELEAMAKTLYDYWFVQFDFPYDFALGKPDTNGKPYRTSGGKMTYNPTLKREIPAGWEVKTIGEYAEVKKGDLITARDTKNGDVKVVAAGVDFSYTHSDFNRAKNTITISGSGANAGFINFWREPIFASDCITVRGATDTETLILLQHLRFIQSHILSQATGSAQPHVYPSDIKILNYIIPSVFLIDNFGKFAIPMNNQIAKNIKENQHLTQLRDWLLPMLMNGQVTVA